jgi:hypothetical protein
MAQVCCTQLFHFETVRGRVGVGEGRVVFVWAGVGAGMEERLPELRRMKCLEVVARELGV